MFHGSKASLLLLLLGLLLSACASTSPTAVSERAEISTTAPGVSTAPPASEAAETTDGSTVDTGPQDEGIATESMTKLGLSGERYATMGDPSAPITLIEFSDYG